MNRANQISQLLAPTRVNEAFGSTGAAPFSPTDITGLLLYFNPTLGVTKDGANRVSQWNDQSGNNNHATQAVLANELVYTINQFGTNPGIVGVAANSQFMTLTNYLNGLTAFTCFIAINAASGSNMYILSGSQGGGGSVIRINGGGGNQVSPWDGAAAFSICNGNATVAGSKYLFSAQSGVAANNTCIVKQNLVALAHALDSGAAWSMDVQYIGQRNGGSAFVDGALGPILLYNTSLSNANMTLVETWYQTNGWT